MSRRVVDDVVVEAVVTTHLLHNTGLALREGDVPTRLVLDELDLDLASLTSGLVIVVIIVVGSGGGGALTLDAACLGVAILELLLLVVIGVVEVLHTLVGHCQRVTALCFDEVVARSFWEMGVGIASLDELAASKFRGRSSGLGLAVVLSSGGVLLVPSPTSLLECARWKQGGYQKQNGNSDAVFKEN